MSTISPKPFDSFSLTLASNATVYELDPAPYSNTQSVIFFNPSTTQTIYVQVATTAGGVPLAAAVTAANSVWVPPGASVTLAIGSEGLRNQLNTAAYWAGAPGAGLNIVVKLGSGASLDINVTYMNNLGGGGFI